MRPVLAVLAVLFLLPLPAGAYHPYDRKVTQEERDAIAGLPEKHRAWIEEVDVLIGEEERATFLALEKDYQRDSFIKRFWEVRDPLPRTARNELKERWEVNVRQAREMFKDLTDGRSRVLLLNGQPEERVESGCSLLLWPLEVWFYARSEQTQEALAVVLYRKWGAGPFRVWSPNEGIDGFFAQSVLQTGGETAAPAGGAQRAGGKGGSEGGPGSARGDGDGSGNRGHSLSEITAFTNGCGDWEHSRKIAAGIAWVSSRRDWDFLELKIVARQEGPGREWVSAFNSYSTDVPEGAVPLPGRLDLAFPGRFQNRTMVQGIVAVPADAPGQAALGSARSVNLLLTGEVLRDGELFDSFRYKFDFPVTETGDGLDPPDVRAPPEARATTRWS